MSHHSSMESSEPFQDIVKKFGLGETGDFPQGKLNPFDEGEIKMAVSNQDNKTILSFGKQVSWIGMDKDQAIELGKMLIEKGESL